MKLIIEIALTHLLHRKRQTIISILGVSLGVGFFIGMAAMMQGFQHYFVTKIIDVWPHITIKDEFRIPPIQPVQRLYQNGAIALHGLKPQEEVRGIRDGETIVDALNKKDGLYAAPTLRAQAFLRYGSKDVSTTVVGIDPDKERWVSQLEKDLIRGDLNALYSVSNGIIMGEGVADKLGAEMNNIISVISPAGIILRMKVVGIFRTGITAIDNFDTYTLLKKAQILQNRPNVINQIRIRLENVDTAGKIAGQIEAQYRYRTESWKETYQNVLGIFVIQNGIMYSTVGAILIVAGFGIFNIISTIIHEKARDIAILKSIGFAEEDIRLTFLLEGLIVGLIGTLLGWGLGHLIVIGLGSIEFDIEGFVKTEGFILYETYLQYGVAGGLALLASSLAAFLPARKAAQLNPVDIIRGGV
jgi:lipoprotein-releasing system permease protein